MQAPLASAECRGSRRAPRVKGACAKARGTSAANPTTRVFRVVGFSRGPLYAQGGGGIGRTRASASERTAPSPPGRARPGRGAALRAARLSGLAGLRPREAGEPGALPDKPRRGARAVVRRAQPTAFHRPYLREQARALRPPRGCRGSGKRSVPLLRLPEMHDRYSSRCSGNTRR